LNNINLYPTEIQIENMEKYLLASLFLFLTFLSIFSSFVYAGSSDFWLECNSTLANCNNQYHYKNGYYCCSTGGGYAWQNNECSYCSCSRKKPSVDIIPSSKSGSKGEKLTYTVNVTNNDNTPCGSSSFTLAVSSCPQNWNCKLSTTQLTISPDQKGSTNIDVTSSASASDGTYTFKVNATNTNSQLSGEGSANYVISTKANPPTTTTIPQGTTTTTIPSSGCGNGKCDYPTETQDNCQDCYTTVQIIPSSTYPGQKVTVIVYFNDSRFNATKDANISLYIDGEYWDNDYCPINGKRWEKDMNCSEAGWFCVDNKCMGTYYGKSVNITRLPGYGSIEAICIIPPNTTSGPHKLRATPTIYSVPVTLRAAETQIKVGDGLYNFVLIVKRIFSRFTGFFFFV
jgi:hypothetical protein